MSEKLKRHREIWRNKKILREIYSEWYAKILRDIVADGGQTIELGAGSGNFKEFKPDVISADIEECEWLDMCFDAHDMPFESNSISNIVMIDVLHHLSSPLTFLKESSRVLKKGGRLVMVEPYPSLISLFVYRRFHPEPFLMDIDYFCDRKNEIKDPWDANQAIAFLLFFKYNLNFQKIVKTLRIVRKERMSCILYPASGGFENKALIPDVLISLLKLFEVLLVPLRPICAFRCYIVLEKDDI